MISSGMTWMFEPFWLFSRSAQETEEIQQWLRDAGVDLMKCPGFDYDGALITTRYYQYGPDGQPMMNSEHEVMLEDQVREFPAVHAPVAVKEWIKSA